MVDGANEINAGQLDGLKMLLVDDSVDVTETMGALCEMEGAEVMIANDGPSALALLAQHDFDVVVSDIGMPGMDGYELLNTLRRSTRNARTPALALTGYGQSEQVLAAGFTDQLCKPAPMAQVLSKIKLLTLR